MNDRATDAEEEIDRRKRRRRVMLGYAAKPFAGCVAIIAVAFAFYLNGKIPGPAFGGLILVVCVGGFGYWLTEYLDDSGISLVLCYLAVIWFCWMYVPEHLLPPMFPMLVYSTPAAALILAGYYGELLAHAAANPTPAWWLGPLRSVAYLIGGAATVFGGYVTAVAYGTPDLLALIPGALILFFSPYIIRLMNLLFDFVQHTLTRYELIKPDAARSSLRYHTWGSFIVLLLFGWLAAAYAPRCQGPLIVLFGLGLMSYTYGARKTIGPKYGDAVVVDEDALKAKGIIDER